MSRMHLPVLAVVVILLFAVVGCSNPAKDKAEAVVADPKAETARGDGESYVIGEGSRIDWVGSKVTGSHDGGFEKFEGEIRVVNGSPEQSTVKVVIDTRSMWSDNDKLTGHLMSPDFFDVEKFPKASFVSTSIVKSDAGYTVTGNLDLHGVTKSISFPAQVEIADGEASATAEFFIKRFDFGIEYKGRADDLIRDEVVIKLQIKAKPV